MALYRDRPDGLLELETDAGPVPVTASEDELVAAGHERDHLGSIFDPSRGALALNDGAGGAPSMGAPSAEPVRSDASTNYGQGGAPAQRLDQDVVDGAAGDPSVQKLSPGTEVVNMTRETQPLRGQAGYDPDAAKRKGPKQERIAVPAGAGKGGGGGKAGFVPFSRTTKKGVEDLEGSIDDINLQRQDQYRAERDAIPGQQQRYERESAARGREIREEEEALRAGRERRARVDADIEQRQGAIDTERKEIENLKIPPRDIFHDKGDLASALSVMLVLAGAVGQAYAGGDNLAERALEEKIDNEIARQRELRANRVEGLKGKETELERLEKIYGTKEAAEAEFRLRAHTVLQKQAEKDAADAGATDALANLHARWASKNEAFELKKLELRGALGDQVQIQEKMNYGGAGGAGAGKKGKIGEATRKRVADIDSALAGLDDMEAADNKNGNPTLLRTGGGYGASDAAQELASIGNAIGPGIARATEGDAATKDSMDRAIGGLVAHSADQRQRTREGYRRQLIQARASAIRNSQGELDESAPSGGGGVPGEELVE